ncbi:tyrosine-type recombinase/integrase [Arcobacter arenosus]|uniref:tyrosine-type recombinase/integrase n=1 Tax=Arcobacter arenosus TaxID=2576037 RepID=UPI003BA91453
MRYLLDNDEMFAKSFLFWLKEFTENKIITTSQRTVVKKNEFNILISTIKDIKTIDEFDKQLKLIRNCGFQGMHIYRLPLIRLYKYLINQKIEKMEDIDSKILIKYLTIITVDSSNATKGNFRRALTNFFNYIDKNNFKSEGLIHTYDFDLRVWEKNSIVPKAKVPVFLDEDEIKSFLISLEEYKNKSNQYYRNSFMIKMFLFTGMRSGELLNLKYKDIEEKEKFYSISVIGKGNKYREVLISKKYIEEFIDKNKLIKRSNDFVFPNLKKGKISQAYATSVVDQILSMAKIKKAKRGTHLLRHTFATQLYRKTKDVHLLKEALGHGDINTSMIYTHIDDNTLEKTTTIMDDLI